MSEKYDAVIIGAGMSGLAAGIRLAMFDKKVVILEKHSISGGLNSYYNRKVKEMNDILKLDVGLHALTNFAKKSEKRKPLTKLLKQLRIPYDDLALREQSYSVINFKSADLKFSNDFDLLTSEIKNVFPSELDSFVNFARYVSEYDELDLNSKYTSARDVLDAHFKDELLKEMLMAPLLIYGSAWENDMDFSQFVVMFKSLYFEGFSRPEGGVRSILDILLDKLSSLGAEVRFRHKVESISHQGDQKIIDLGKKGTIKAPLVLSSIGIVETNNLFKKDALDFGAKVGKLSFLESIHFIRDKKPIKDFKATIVFHNDSDKYKYERPSELSDFSSAVFCLPNNYAQDNDGYGTIRVTYMANYDDWKSLDKKSYKEHKHEVANKAFDLSKKFLSGIETPFFSDTFSPTTIERYTGHLGGAVYGSPDKVKDGKIGIPGVYIIGTDQGFLGIVGSMLSGISMANLYGLMEQK